MYPLIAYPLIHPTHSPSTHPSTCLSIQPLTVTTSSIYPFSIIHSPIIHPSIIHLSLSFLLSAIHPGISHLHHPDIHLCICLHTGVIYCAPTVCHTLVGLGDGTLMLPEKQTGDEMGGDSSVCECWVWYPLWSQAASHQVLSFQPCWPHPVDGCLHCTYLLQLLEGGTDWFL